MTRAIFPSELFQVEKISEKKNKFSYQTCRLFHVELHESMKMRNVYKILEFFWIVTRYSAWIVTWIVMLVGCSKPMDNPEIKDPIYLDLKKLADEYSKTVVDTQKKKAEAYKKFLETPANTLDKKLEYRNYAKIEKEYKKAHDMAQYYQIRMERRKIEGKLAYLESYEKKEEWPKPEEYKAFLTNQKLRNAPTSWDARVPKNADRYSRKPADAGKKEEKKEAKAKH